MKRWLNIDGVPEGDELFTGVRAPDVVSAGLGGRNIRARENRLAATGVYSGLLDNETAYEKIGFILNIILRSTLPTYSSLTFATHTVPSVFPN